MAVIRVGRAPTMFGEVSFRVEMHLDRGEVPLTFHPPPRRPNQVLVRLSLPPGWEVILAIVAENEVGQGREGAVDLSGRSQRCTVRFGVGRKVSRER